MKCKKCKFDNNCEPKYKAQWIYGERRKVTGCNLGVKESPEQILQKIKESESEVLENYTTSR